MRKILIFGNSGSGKSTLATELCISEELAHLDLDELAWLPTNPPERGPLDESFVKIQEFTAQHDAWVIEGCYTDLLELVSAAATEIIFLKLPIKLCIENARNRAWEPHKYESKEVQDANLDMLLEWIAQYDQREGVLSLDSHQSLYNQFSGKKTVYSSNDRDG
jgi:adenylate kinase family enzyme|tara:strand:+ start:283 stop:771 length:489 start_codon:yes stop_codon:yes gene_type:complete